MNKPCRVCGKDRVPPYRQVKHDYICNLCNNDKYKGIPKTRRAQYNNKPLANKETYSNKRKAQIIQYKYGLTIEQYTALYNKQNGTCAICHTPLIKPHIDHDHTTGIVRGLLCLHCNLVLGHAKDSTKTLESAIAYLQDNSQEGF